MLVVLFHLYLCELTDAHSVGGGWRRAPGGGGRMAPFTLGFWFHCPQPRRWSNTDILVTVSRVCLPPVTSDVDMRREGRGVQVSPDESWHLQNLGHTQKRVLRPSALRKKWYCEQFVIIVSHTHGSPEPGPTEHACWAEMHTRLQLSSP